MTPIIVDLVVKQQLVRLSAWTAEEPQSGRWRASALVRQADGQFALSSDGAVIHGASAAEALGRLAAGVLAQLLPLEPPPAEPGPANPVALPVPAEAETAPPAPISLNREERSAQLTQTIDQAIERLAQQLSEGHTVGFLETMRFYSRFWKYSLGNLS